ncbi:MAG: hypothetical protein AABZ57_00295 [Candidatus Margulisiibacteriota bacterium]
MIKNISPSEAFHQKVLPMSVAIVMICAAEKEDPATKDNGSVGPAGIDHISAAITLSGVIAGKE